jgi:hypothetical protein
MTGNFGGYRLMFQSPCDGARHTDPRPRQAPETFSPSDCANYLGGNIAELVIDASRRWLSLHSSS